MYLRSFLQRKLMDDGDFTSVTGWDTRSYIISEARLKTNKMNFIHKYFWWIVLADILIAPVIGFALGVLIYG